MHHLSQNVASECKICQHPNWEEPASADSAMGPLPLSLRIPLDSSLQPPDRPKLCIIKNIRLTNRQWTIASGRLHKTIDTPRLLHKPYKYEIGLSWSIHVNPSQTLVFSPINLTNYRDPLSETATLLRHPISSTSPSASLPSTAAAFSASSSGAQPC